MSDSGRSNPPGPAFRLGMGQMLVEPGAARANLDRAVRMIREAAAQGCRVVVLPECLDLGWMASEARELAAPIPGAHSDAICRAANEAGVFVAAGLTERAGERIYNAAILASPQGEILLKHRKINELDIARDLYAIGDRLGVAETPLGVFGLLICADCFPESLVLAHSLALMGCQLLLSPCAWAVEADHDNERDPYGGLWLGSYTELAKLHGITVAGVSNVGWLRSGPWAGRKCIGCSLAVGADGHVLARGPYGDAAEALILVDVLLARGAGMAPAFGPKGCRRP